MHNYQELFASLELGKRSKYPTHYDPHQLQIVPRSLNRDTLTINTPFYGYDLWRAYELSCLNSNGKPLVGYGTIIVPASSEAIVESKSLKLYLNSFNQEKLPSLQVMQQMVAKDLSDALKCQVEVQFYPLEAQIPPAFQVQPFSGILLDNLDVAIDCYEVCPDLITQDKSAPVVTETLVCNLLKSNCLITGQPDWGTAVISYTGQKLNHESLLRYIVSLRNHNEFHEHCVERIFTDLANHATLSSLQVSAFYTRRGGLDINPCRSSSNVVVKNVRLLRQ